MRKSDDALTLKAKLRSAQTMLSDERTARRLAEREFELTVEALEASNNGEIKEAVRTLGEARACYEAARVVLAARAAERADAGPDADSACNCGYFGGPHPLGACTIRKAADAAAGPQR